jgi:hypothetical protein
MSCVSIVFFAVLIKDSTSKFFRLERGLKQRYLLSPLLFFIVVEGLSRVILEEKRAGDFKEIRAGNALYLSHLLFVDNIPLFYDGSCMDALMLRVVLDLYCFASRMEINAGKSSISFREICEEEYFFSQISHYRQVELERFMNYLGFYLKPNDYTKKD